MLDLDHFKTINDQSGHQAGDHMLEQVASILIRNIRPYDKLYRYGGDEFIIMLPNTPRETVLSMAERMRRLVENASINIDNQPVRTTVSISISAIYPDKSVEASIEEADKAMYAAKEAGRNMVRLWDASLAGE